METNGRRCYRSIYLSGYTWSIRVSIIKTAFHETDVDTDTDILARIVRKSRVSDVSATREDVDVRVDVGVVECGLYTIYTMHMQRIAGRSSVVLCSPFTSYCNL